MAVFEITSPDGKTFEVTAPEGATQEQVLAYAQSQFGAKEHASPTPGPRSASYIAGSQVEPTPLNGALRGLASVVNGPTFGFGDEILGAAGGLYDKVTKGGDLAQLYKNNRDYVRGVQDREKDENPWTAGITQAMASAPVAVAMPFLGAAGKAQAPMGVIAQSVRTALSGAANGAISGAGNSTADTVEGVAADSAKSAALGSVLGGAITPVTRAIGAVGGNIMQRVSNTSAGTYAQRKVAEALARDAEGTAAASGASNPVLQAEARFRSLQGQGGAVADAGGQNTKGLLDLVASMPGDTKNTAVRFVRDRQNSSAGRLIESAEQNMGAGGQRLLSTVDDLIADRSAAAAPLYAQLRQTTVAQPSQALTDAVLAAEKLGATSVAKRIAVGEQIPFTLDTKNPGNWSAGDLDFVKQGLDKLISGRGTNATTGRLNPEGTSLLSLKNALVNEIDAATTNPQTGQSLYQATRAAYAGPSALIKAATDGRNSLSMSGDAIAKITSTMTPSEQQAFRIGTYEALRAKMGSSAAGRAEIMNMRQNPVLAEKLQEMFGSDRAFRQFAATASKEDLMKQLNSFIGGGSKTFSRSVGLEDLGNDALGHVGDAAKSAATANVPGALTSLFRAGKEAVKTPENTRNAIGQILLSTGQEGRQNMGELAMVMQALNANRAAQSGAAGSVIGNSTGAFSNRNTNGIIGSNVRN